MCRDSGLLPWIRPLIIIFLIIRYYFLFFSYNIFLIKVFLFVIFFLVLLLSLSPSPYDSAYKTATNCFSRIEKKLNSILSVYLIFHKYIIQNDLDNYIFKIVI